MLKVLLRHLFQLTDNIKEGLSFLNQKRAELGLSSLVVNQKLMQSALAHAEYISYNQVVGHMKILLMRNLLVAGFKIGRNISDIPMKHPRFFI